MKLVNILCQSSLKRNPLFFFFMLSIFRKRDTEMSLTPGQCVEDAMWSVSVVCGSDLVRGNGNLYIFVINQNIINNKIGSCLPFGII